MQIAGKDNLRQQSSMWQAMLLSAGIQNSKQILIHGFLTSGGQKISKSSDNATDPFEYVNKFGTDALRYYLLAKVSPFEDSDFTEEKFQEAYVADLANGLGNLVARTSNLLEKNKIELNLKKGSDEKLKKEFEEKMENYKFNEALEVLWAKLRGCDEIITRTEPWKIKDVEEVKKVLEPVAENIFNVAELLQPFMPQTAEKILAQFGEKQIKKGEPLFPRISK
jgi:methionyl-tRNA synthetase